MVLSPDPRSLSYTIPLVLPSDFELKVDVLAWSSDLARIRIAGHPLATPALSARVPDREAKISGDRESWHEVRLVRDHDLLSLWVDSQGVPVAHVETTGEWLTIEPAPLRPAAFRNLIVTW